MRYFRDKLIPPAFQGGVVTLGNFDGVHLGHQVIIQTLVGLARERGVPSVVVTFEPQPQEFFADEKPTRVMTLREKAMALAALGVDALVVIPFNRRFAAQTAEAFIQDFLKHTLRASHLVVGHDCRFGAHRAGNIQSLRLAGLTVTEVAAVTLQGERISSSAIRQALKTSDLLKAEKYLGTRYRMVGRVRRGDGRGRDLGFPTANIDPRRLPALRGVYVVSVKAKDGTIYPAVANLGTRPTVCGMRTLLEVHLLDTNMTLYGERLEVVFLHFIRGEQRFASLEALKAQIADDVAVARKMYGGL